MLAAAGLPVGMGKGLYEADSKSCSHCQRIVVVLHKRTPGYCPKCNKYVCERCDAMRQATGECTPFKKIIEHFDELAAQATSGVS